MSNSRNIRSVQVRKKATKQTRRVYRKLNRSQEGAHLSIRLAKDTVDSITQIRKAFYTRYPQAGYPTLSAAFEYVVLRNARELIENPCLLAQEVDDFQRRYCTK